MVFVVIKYRDNFLCNNRKLEFINYGFFHFAYLIFLLTGTFTKAYGNIPNYVELKYIFLTALLFFVNHLFSYFYNRPRDTKKQNIGSLMFYPYARIIPMHIVEHNVLRKGEEPQL